jgi:hypothetical protein
VLKVNACDNNTLLMSQPGSELTDVSDGECKGLPAYPDGTTGVAAVDLTSAVETGTPGVLGRYQLQAVGPGRSVLTLSDVLLADNWANEIAVEEVHDGNWTPQFGVILVDADLDGDGLNDCEDPDADGDGFLNAKEEARGSDPLSAASTVEECDGLDNDGDTEVDEDYPDTNPGGPKDCLDPLVDTDGDTLVNTVDSDDDNDGFSDVREIFIGLSSLEACGLDAWALDTKYDRVINILDIVPFIGPLRSGVYDRRFDLNTDHQVNILDVVLYIPELDETCTNP